jgi:hypothetical protein
MRYSCFIPLTQRDPQNSYACHLLYIHVDALILKVHIFHTFHTLSSWAVADLNVRVLTFFQIPLPWIELITSILLSPDQSKEPSSYARSSIGAVYEKIFPTNLPQFTISTLLRSKPFWWNDNKPYGINVMFYEWWSTDVCTWVFVEW